MEDNNGKESDSGEKLKNKVIKSEEFIVKEVDVKCFGFYESLSVL